MFSLWFLTFWVSRLLSISVIIFQPSVAFHPSSEYSFSRSAHLFLNSCFNCVKSFLVGFLSDWTFEDSD